MLAEKDERIASIVLSVNVRYKPYDCETCLVENGWIREYFVWEEMEDLLAYVTQISIRHPTVLLALVTDMETNLCSLTDLLQQVAEQDRQKQNALLYALRPLNDKCILLPAVKYAPAVPLHRQRFSSTLGLPHTLCMLATLLYRMRQQDADWAEMTFFYLELHPMSYTLVVVKEGSVVDGTICDFTSQRESVSEPPEFQEQTSRLLELAFWERLTRDLAGLVAIHYIEDIVLHETGKEVRGVEHYVDADNQMTRQEAAIERLGDTYKLYLFPQDQNEQAGRETVFGACLLAEGLLHADHAVEIAQRLISVLSLPS
jgi:hypothetical protein